MGSIDYPFGTYPRAIIRSPLSSGAKALYVTLADYTTLHNLTCFPSRTRLCGQLCWSQHTLEKYTRELIGSGWIGKEPRRDEQGQFRGWLYRIHTSPLTNSDQAGGAVEPIQDAKSTGRQNLRAEEDLQIFQEEKEEKHTHMLNIPKVDCRKESKTVCETSFAKKDETTIEDLSRSVAFTRNSEAKTGQGRWLTPEEQETIDLTIEKYRAQGTLQNLPGLLRYFAIHGVDTSYLSGLREWKRTQAQQAIMDEEAERLRTLRTFQEHLLTCKQCKGGEQCEEGRALRPNGIEGMGCFGCQHMEIEETLLEYRMIYCRQQRATVPDPLTYRCPSKT